MKKLSVLLLAVAFGVSSVASASVNPNTVEEEVREEVQLSLKKPSFKIEKELKADVTLMLNQENEMIVVSVDSDDKQLESFIKSRLNYKKIDLSIKKSGNFFKIPVRIVER